MLRALFAGLGGIGQRHLRNLRALLGDEVVISAYRVRGERDVLDDKLRVTAGEDLVDKYGIRVFDDLEEGLSAGQDVVFVTNPTSLHVPVALQAAQHGCDLLIEKPLSNSLEQVSELAALVEKRKLVAFVAYQLRQHPGFRRLRALLEAGTLGRICAVSVEVGEYLPGFHPYEDYRRMYASRRDLGGGVTITQIHEIDLLLALFGVPERVYSVGGKLSGLEIDVEDVASSLLEYRRQDGERFPVRLHQDYLQRPPTRYFRIVGDAGRAEWSLSSSTFTLWNETGEVVELVSYQDFPRNQLFIDELSHFLECVKERKRPEVDIRDGAASLQIGIALRKSQLSGMPVGLGQQRAAA